MRAYFAPYANKTPHLAEFNTVNFFCTHSPPSEKRASLCTIFYLFENIFFFAQRQIEDSKMHFLDHNHLGFRLEKRAPFLSLWSMHQ